MKPRAAANAIRPKIASWSAGSCTREAYSRAAVSALARILERMGRHGRFFAAPLSEEYKRPISRATVRRVVATFRPYRRRVGVVAVAIIVTSALGIVNPLLIKRVFDTGLNCTTEACHPDLPVLYRLVALMIAIPIITSAIGVGQTYLSNLIGLKVMQDLRNGLYRHLQFMPLRFFTSTRTGEIQSRLANDVGGVQSVVTSTAASLLANVVIILSTLVAMLILSWQLTVMSLCITPIFIWLTVKVGRARREVATNTQKTLADLTAITEETLSVSGILLSKSFGRQRHEINRYREENERLTGFTIRQTMIGQSFFAIVGTFFSIMPALTYLVVGWVTSNNPAAMTAGTIVAFTTLQSRIFFPIGSMLQISNDVQTSFALFDRIFEYLDMPHDIKDAPDAIVVEPEQVRGQVRMRHVKFHYDTPPPDEVPISPSDEAAALAVDQEGPRPWTLDDVDLEILPGQLAALVGPSGAGKTTITYLVPRLYDVQEGAVEIDGIDVRKIALESIGDMVGVVTQETYLFHTTIRRNLLYGKPDATQEELEAAAKAANIHDRIVELAEGYDTIVGERGYKLSGGEKQRLAIARVVLKDPRILILDEATSSLDTNSERLVQAALEPLMEGRTTIAIAHRLSTILKADVIFVIDRGKVAERGTHDELLAKGGLYAQLYQQQFKGGLVQAECEDGVILADGQVVRTSSASGS
jgi:ATP-binding cassette subfamily B protein